MNSDLESKYEYKDVKISLMTENMLSVSFNTMQEEILMLIQRGWEICGVLREDDIIQVRRLRRLRK